MEIKVLKKVDKKLAVAISEIDDVELQRNFTSLLYGEKIPSNALKTIAPEKVITQTPEASAVEVEVIQGERPLRTANAG